LKSAHFVALVIIIFLFAEMVKKKMKKKQPLRFSLSGSFIFQKEKNKESIIHRIPPQINIPNTN